MRDQTFQVEFNGLADVLQGLLLSFALTMAALQRGAIDVVPSLRFWLQDYRVGARHAQKYDLMSRRASRERFKFLGPLVPWAVISGAAPFIESLGRGSNPSGSRYLRRFTKPEERVLQVQFPFPGNPLGGPPRIVSGQFGKFCRPDPARD